MFLLLILNKQLPAEQFDDYDSDSMELFETH